MLEYIRASSISTYLECSAKFLFQNILEIKTPNKVALAFGSAIHNTLEENFKQKVRTRQDIPIEYAKDFFSDSIDSLLQDVAKSDFIGFDTPKNLKDTGIELVEKYQKEHAYRIFPKRVEEQIQVKFNGFPYGLSGKIDLLDEDLILVDHKTSGKDFSELPESYRIQVGGAYPILIEALEKQPINGTRIDFLIRKSDKSQTTKIRPISIDVDKKHFFNIFEKVSIGIQNGVFITNRDHMFCSKKWCKFHEFCEKEFGGHVKN